jgi:aryl-alcohol dehydrogenase-like predicted oxidoreductase
MPLDHFVTLGRSGLRVSPFCLGTMTFGEDHGWGASPAESESILADYLDRGGNFIDTANIYTNGHSEKIVGDYFADRPGLRDRVVIGTKFFGSLYEGDPNGGGAGRKAIVQQCEQSLRRLQTDYVDIYWLHNWDPAVPIEETMRALDDLVAAGKVRYVGVSDLPAWKAAEADLVARFRGWSPVIGMQVEYSLLERTPEGELLPMAAERGIGVLPWGPLRGGLLSGKFSRRRPTGPGTPRPGENNSGENDGGDTARHDGENNSGDTRPLVGDKSRRHGHTESKRANDSTRGWVRATEADYDVLDVLDQVADEAGVSPAAVALSWLQNRPAVTSTLIGARRLGQLRANLDAIDVQLSRGQVDRLDEVSAPKLNFPAENNRHLAPGLAFAGATVDGVATAVHPSLQGTITR